MATSLEDARAIERACRENGVILMMGYHLRFHAGHQKLARLIAEGAIGEPLSVRISWTMQAPLPIFGAGGIRGLARGIARLDPAAPDSSRFVGHIVRMQEEIGTGGAGFRFLYAAFLQEAAEAAGLPQLAEFSNRLMEVGDEWRGFALAAARMVKGRDAFDPPAIAQLLHALAAREAGFFRDLKAALP